MSICLNCGTRANRPCTYEARTKECYDALIAALRFRAEICGYAIAVHGSLKTDIDLVAIPWRAGAIDAISLAEQIRKTAEQIIGCARVRDVDKDRLPEKKPAGRLAWSFYLTPFDSVIGPYIDLSVTPIPVPPVIPTPRKKKKK